MKAFQSLGTKFVLQIAVIITIMMIMVGFVMTAYQERKIRQRLAAKAALVVEQLMITLRHPIWSYDDPLIHQILQSFLHDPDILSIRVSDGHTLDTSWGKDPSTDEIVNLTESPAISYPQDFTPFSSSQVEIRSDETVLAICDISFSSQQITTQIHETRVAVSIVFVSLLLVETLTILLWVRREITRPLRVTVEAAQQISQGKFDIRLIAHPHNEIGFLNATFVRMSHQLKTIFQQRDQLVAELRANNNRLQTEILERQHAEQILAEERNLLRTLIDHLPDFIYVKDTMCRYLLANQAVLHSIDAITLDEVVGKTDVDLFDFEEVHQFYRSEQEVLASGQPIMNQEEQSKYALTGEDIWLLTTKIPVRDSQGNITGIVGISRNITARKQAEEELRKHRDHLEELVKDRSAELITANEHLKQEIAERKRAEKQLTLTLQETQKLFDAAQAILGASGLSEICRNLLKYFKMLAQADRMMLTLIDRKHRRISFVQGYGNIPEHPEISYEELEAGISGMVLRSGEPILSLSADDGIEPQETAKRRKQLEVGALIVLPLMTKQNVIGTVVVMNRIDQRAFTPHDVDLLMTLAAQAATAIENARLFQEEQWQRQMAESLREVTTTVTSSLQQDTVLDTILAQLRRVIPYDRAGVFLREGETLVLSDGAFLNEAFLGSRLPLSGNSLEAQVFRTRKPLIIENALTDPRWEVWEEDEPIRSWMGVSLFVGENGIGLLTTDSYEVGTYRDEDSQILQSFANQAAIAIENAQLFKQAQQELTERRRAQEALQKLNEELEERVKERTIKLQETNQALQQSLETLQMAQTQLVQSEKMAALGILVAGVAHEINTPVGIGVTAASHLQQKTQNLLCCYETGAMTRSDLERYLHTADETARLILQNLLRAAEQIQSFKRVAVDQASDKQRRFKLKAYIDDLLLSLHPKLKRTQHTVVVHCSDDLEIVSYPGAFSQIFTNLILNSLIHGFEHQEQGEILLEVFSAQKELHIRYSDNGRGMTLQERSHIFDPFYTTKRGQGSTGLGMHIVYNLVTQQLGGRIQCESTPGVGTTFMIQIPINRSLFEHQNY